MAAFQAAKTVYQTHTKSYGNEVAKAPDPTLCRVKLLQQCTSNINLKPALDKAAQLDNVLREALNKLPEALQGTLGDLLSLIDDVMEPDTWTRGTQDAIRTLCGNAAYTYSEEIQSEGHSQQETQDSVDNKFKQDARAVTVERVTVLISPALSYVFKSKLSDTTSTLESSLLSNIPETVAEMLSPSGIIDTIFDNMAEEVAQETAEKHLE
eukprot:TRINITY_DN10876_c0_g5_i3.p2 TRINITY_DN10876_c0_g5~~TRINITY_DN10876_c0_g5_i3.p2  ORF type:complete len:243 (+),score=61.37 TRINITY_DN10876_c0_g5_i3:101-730(+)